MYLAKDFDGEVWLFNKKPMKQKKVWTAQKDTCEYPFRLTDDDIAKLEGELRSISWDDKEPREVILVARPQAMI